MKTIIDMNKITNIIAQTNWKQQGKDIFFLFVGVLMYATGYTAFILPEKVVQGAVAGISALIYYTTSFPPSISIWVLNAMMIIIAIKALTPQFVIRTVIGVTMLSLCVVFLQPFFTAHPIITPGEDKFMHVLIAALLCGTGLGIGGLIAAGYLMFGRSGLLGKIGGALLAMMMISGNSRQQALAVAQENTQQQSQEQQHGMRR